MNRIFRYTIFYLLIFLVIIGIFGTFNGGKKTTEDLNYHAFFEALESNKVDSISVIVESLANVFAAALNFSSDTAISNGLSI